ncbi:nuclease-related domain-containing protein [Halomonas tibetensis]|uniref:Nuclease-related domain-containing protein n=1 Tax=Halomonas tibetensis TaxID=2259590 RepID=A0ABV7B4Y9_9GAMM
MIEHGGERAQIDHLVIHPYGFIIIESKSIVGEVQVNAEDEWSRSYKGNWSGIASPIRQAELQQEVLKALLRNHVEKLLGKLLGIQTQIGGRYVKCASCNTDTSMKQPCPACGWKSVKVSKDGPSYTAACRKCDHQYLVYRQAAGKA